MRINKYCLLLFLLALTVSGCGDLLKPTYITRILNHGIYQSGMSKRITADEMASGGVRIIENTTLVEQTSRIPAKIGTRFGFKYIIEGKNIPNRIDIVAVWTFPPPGLQNPKTNRTDRENKFAATVNTNEELYMEYGFDHSWELIPGKWKFQVKHKGNVLATQTFEVYTPDIIASYEKIHQHYLFNLPPDQKLFFNSHEQYLILGAQNGALIASVGDSAFVVYDKTTSGVKILVYDSSKLGFKELYKDVSVIDSLPELKGYGYSGTNVVILQGLLRDYETTIIKDPLSWVNEFPLLKCAKLDQDSTFVLSHAIFANGYDASNIGNYTCLCLPFDSTYNNWECFVYDKKQNAFVKIYGQAFAD